MFDAEILGKYKLFIFDADDTLRRTTVPGQPCPRSPEEWELLPGVVERLSSVNWNQPGRPCFGIASNQDQVAYGHLSLETARALLRDLARAAAGFDPPDAALQLCAHSLEVQCRCRKPEGGMLKEIMRHYSIKAVETLFVGNHQVDRDAAARARTSFMWASDFFGLDDTSAPSIGRVDQQA